MSCCVLMAWGSIYLEEGRIEAVVPSSYSLLLLYSLINFLSLEMLLTT